MVVINRKMFAAAALVLASALMAGCQREVSCSAGSGGRWECRGTVQWMIQKASAPDRVDTYDLANFNGSYVKGVTSKSNVTLKASGSPYATVSLYNDGLLVARKSFETYVSGSNILPSNPTELSNWVRGYSNAVDDFRVTLDGVEINPIDGTNQFTLEWQYQQTTVGGGSYSFYRDRSGGGYCDGHICYDPL